MRNQDAEVAALRDRGPKWDLYRYFLAVAKAESVTGAAQVLRESPPTVSRKVRELEAHFAGSLFRRPPGRLELTAAGQTLLERLARIDREMSDLHADIAGARSQLSGRVTITAPRGFGKAVLLDCLGRLRETMPEVEFVALFKMKKLNLSHREADIAIRVGTPEGDGMTVQRIGDVGFGLYASSLYLNKHGAPRSITDLRPEHLIGLAGADDLVQIAEVKRLAPDLAPRLSVDCILLQAQTVALGVGYAPLPRYMTKSFPNLVEILPGTLTSSASLWALTQPDIAQFARVSTTLSALVAEVRTVIQPDTGAP